MKKILGNKSLVTILAMALCVGILTFAYSYRVKVALDTISVPVAARDIQAREGIVKNEGMIEYKDIPKSMITSNVIINDKDIFGKYVNYNTMIPQGSVFYSGSIVDWKHMPDSAWEDIPTCSTIVSLPVNSNTTYGNSIYPGDKIDLFYQAYDEKGQLFIGQFIQGIEVLAVKDSNGNHVFNKTNNQSNAAALIFNVSDAFITDNGVIDLHLLFRNAMYAGGEIIPVPRNKDYKPETMVDNEYVINYINGKMINPQDDLESIECKTQASQRVAN